MTYTFDTLYSDWVSDIQMNSPSTPDSYFTVDNFFMNVDAEIEELMNSGDDIPDHLIFLTQNDPPVNWNPNQG